MSGPTTYKVTEAVGPLGLTPVVKQAIDVREVYVDFSAWLAAGETLAAMSNFAIEANPSGNYPSWQTDFPYTETTSDPPADSSPLVMVGADITTSTTGRLLIGNGTPGLTYMFSFLATAAPSQRKKEIDLLVSVNLAINSEMITSATLPDFSVTAVGGTTSLATGTSGDVNVTNVAAANITITLPGSPVSGQEIQIKDIAGNAGTYSITVVGASGATIDSAASYVMDQDYQETTFYWSGAQWSVR